jgi:hypothetical protein
MSVARGLGLEARGKKIAIGGAPHHVCYVQVLRKIKEEGVGCLVVFWRRVLDLGLIGGEERGISPRSCQDLHRSPSLLFPNTSKQRGRGRCYGGEELVKRE